MIEPINKNMNINDKQNETYETNIKQYEKPMKQEHGKINNVK